MFVVVRLRDRLLTLASPLALLITWEALAQVGVIDKKFFSCPSEIVGTAIVLIQEGRLQHDVLISLSRIFAGFLFGAIPGAIIGILMGLSRTINAIVSPLAATIFPIPKIAILPLLMIIFGIGEGSKIALIAMGSVFLTLYSTSSGVKNLPPIFEEVSRSFGASRLQYVRLIVMRAALPNIFVGLKLSLQTSLLLIVAAEFVGAKTGIGQLIWSSWEIFAVDQMFVGLLTLSALGYILTLSLDAIERILLPWRERGRPRSSSPTHAGARSAIAVTIVAIAVFATIALAWTVSPANAQTPEELAPLSPEVTINVGVAGQLGDAALYLGVERGLFRKYGLNVQLTSFQNSGQMVSALGTGQLDVGGGNTNAGLWNASDRGIGIKAVLDKGVVRPGNGYMGLVVASNSPIKSCSDLKGRKLANSASANGVLHTIELYLNSCGLTLSDVQLSVLSFPETAAAIASGAVDVGHLGEPLLSINERSGKLRVLVRQDLIREHDQIGVLLFSPVFISKPDVARRFTVAYALAAASYGRLWPSGRAPADELVDVLVKYTPLKDRTIVSAVIPPAYNEFAELDLKSMRSDFDWFRQKRLIKNDSARFEDAIDTSFGEFARKYLSAYPARP